MSNEALNAANALDSLASNLEGFWTDQSFGPATGSWNVPPVTRQMLSTGARRLAERIRTLPEAISDPALREVLTRVPENVQWILSNTIPNGAGGNALHLVAVINGFMSTVELCLPVINSPPPPALPSWEDVENSKLIPVSLGRRIRSLSASIERLEPNVASIQRSVDVISEAHSTALELPTDLQSLREIRQEFERERDNLALIAQDAQAARVAIDDELSEAVSASRATNSVREEAESTMKKIDGAYSAATTIGLAKAFSDRADSLTESTRYWVGGLMAALLLGGALGYLRLDHLQALMAAENTDPQRLWINLAMSFVAVAAPVWVAWLATRQIGQRFRLAEDYAFKASVAKAYEGYRREAVRIDVELEKRLFSSALDRLDEPPLRFLPMKEHSTPYMEILDSPGFQRALEKLPDFRAAVADAVKKAKLKPEEEEEAKPKTRRARAAATDAPTDEG